MTRLAEPSFNIVLGEPGAGVPATLGSTIVSRLLERSVSVSHQGLVRELRDLDPPSAFQRSPALRRHRWVVLDEAGTAWVGQYRLTYDDQLGLRVNRDGRH